MPYQAPCREIFDSIPDKLNHFLKCEECKRIAREAHEERQRLEALAAPTEAAAP